ncbi:hypothetical protein QUB70_28165 [Microcoleus sp. A003_D6]|uniref:hypothetical protein n=1 Tax=Microcoleus sp. A003_D6 TaxID=3055266 RepID=UPI002FD780F4
MNNPKTKNVLSMICFSVIGTVIITLPMRMLLDSQQPVLEFDSTGETLTITQ